MTGLTATKTWLSLLPSLHVFILGLRRDRLDLQLPLHRLVLRRLGLIHPWFIAAAPFTFAAVVSLAILLLPLLEGRLKLPVPRGSLLSPFFGLCGCYWS